MVESSAIGEDTPFESVATELLRELRGKRSRPQFSRILGYRSNIAQRWETEACWPTTSRFFSLCVKLRLEPKRVLAKFLRREPSWLATVDLTHPSGIGALLTEVQGRTPIHVVAERAGYNRYSVARWLRGSADPKLPELLRLLEACTGRSLDFVAALVDPSHLPSAAARWKQLELLKEGAYTHPWSHAVLHALELEGYRKSGRNSVNYLAERTGLSREDVEATLLYLVKSGQAKKVRNVYCPVQQGVVDTGGDPTRARALRIAWSRRAVERLERLTPGDVGYSLFAISKQDLKRVQQLQQEFLRQMQTLIASSRNCDCVALYCAQLLDLSEITPLKEPR